ncbi:MAG TPA: DUF885 domain-containing protein [Puia sp.]|nr:DUF885 domain-containing protein [Puia sp.]
MIRSFLFNSLLAAAYCMLPTQAKPQSTPVSDKSWIKTSDSYTQLLIDIDNKYSPENGTDQGLAEYDTLVSVPTLRNEQAKRKELEALLNIYKTALNKKMAEPVKQDLQILINRLQLDFRLQDYYLANQVPFLNAAASVYDGLESLLDQQTPENRRAAVVERLRKYAGLTAGYRPLTAIYTERVKEQMAKPGIIYPSRQEIDLELSRNASVMDGIEALCKKYNLSGWEHPYAQLKKQIADYDAWTKSVVLPRGRTDFKLPPAEYALKFQEYGIDIPPAQIAKMAHERFTQIQEEMKGLAAQIAKARHLSSADYRDVIRELKKNQLHGDSIIPVYEQHLKDIEAIIREHQIVSLPDRPAIIRLATAAETARQPAPHMVPPPFLNNTGQRGVFVLPLNMPEAPGAKSVDKYDDFTFDAASWTVTAHEARPGHEMQFDKMVEEGVSKARALYAFNSTNVEGWGLYSEYLIRPYMPDEGKLVSLDYLLLRAARAFLDPELQAGKITADQAFKVLTDDVVQSRAFAREEVERFTLNAPGQANSYFYGFTKMLAMRKDTEQALGSRFNLMRFHDFILSQGLLPPDLLRKAVEEDFIPQENKN